MQKVRSKRRSGSEALQKRKLWQAGLLGFALLLLACGGDSSSDSATETLMHQSQAVKTNAWDMQDTLTFQLPELEESAEAEAEVTLRFTREVPYEKVQLSATLQHSDSLGRTILGTNLLTYELYDEEGRLQGHSFLHHEVMQTIRNLRLEKGKSYQLLITHRMHSRRVAGLTDVCVRLLKKKQ